MLFANLCVGQLIKPRAKPHHPAVPDEMHQVQDGADEKATDDTHQQAEDVQFLNDQCREIKAHRAIAVAVKDRVRRSNAEERNRKRMADKLPVVAPTARQRSINLTPNC